MSFDRPLTVNDPAFWETLYARGDDGWELGRPAPPLEEYLRRHRPLKGNVGVLGCGRGHDARLLTRLGYGVWGFDFADRAIGEAQSLAKQEGLEITFEQRDIFDLATEYQGFFDGVWEYTCFCAIDPSRRSEYVRLVRTILKPEGWLLACFYPLREGTDGPPFPATEPEIRRLFTPDFTLLETYVPTASVERRAALEWMVMARAHPRLRRGDPASGAHSDCSASP
ncbi:MAG: methyltransferase domain-containing protein [Candidatus Rokubacteria bacterium]|nr:methyltransferase domain-containing protein [Candidatus Rokubacteria bacterium]